MGPRTPCRTPAASGVDPLAPTRGGWTTVEPVGDRGGELERPDVPGVEVGDRVATARDAPVVEVAARVDEETASARSAPGTSGPAGGRGSARRAGPGRDRPCRARSRKGPRPSRRCSRRGRGSLRGRGSPGSSRRSAGSRRTTRSCRARRARPADGRGEGSARSPPGRRHRGTGRERPRRGEPSGARSSRCAPWRRSRAGLVRPCRSPSGPTRPRFCRAAGRSRRTSP